MEKVHWNSIDKKQNGLKYSKNDKSSTLPHLNNQNMKNHPPSPAWSKWILNK